MSFFHNLASAFKGGGGVRVPVTRGFSSPSARPFTGAFQDDRRGAPFDYASAIQRGFVENPVAQRAVRIVSEGVGSAPVTCSDDRLKALIGTTSAGQSLTETLAMHLLLHGNAYVQIIKDAACHPIELFALRPERVSVVAGADGWPAAYEYRPSPTRPDHVLSVPLEDDRGWPEIIHLRSIHPADDHYGAGTLAAAEQAVAIHNAAMDWNRALLENAARPSGALVYDGGEAGGLTAEQFDRLQLELAGAYAGGANAGRPMLLEGGLDWKAMSLSPADMDFATLKAAAARDIALAFGVPPMLLGLPGDNTYSNYREANKALWRLTLLPLAEKIHGGLRQGLADWFRGATLEVDMDRISALSEDRERLWSQVSAADFLSNAEKRAMLGLDALSDDGKDKP